jgi:hypothetical protein
MGVLLMISTLTAAQQWLDLASNTVSEPVLPARPFQLITLWDMLRFEAPWFYRATFEIDRQICVLGKEIQQRGRDDRLTEAEAAEVTDALHRILSQCKRIGLSRSQERIDDILMHVQAMPGHLFVTLLRTQQMLLELRTAIVRDLDQQVFLSLPLSDINYYEQEQLFGLEVFTNFPSTRPDVAEAGNCYATGRYTACVFHCMRVLEKGLHALVRDLNNSFGANVVFNKDIEYVNWGNIIEKIDAEIRGLLHPNRQPRLVPDDLQFYSQTATEFVYFKNAWRDDVSHSRSAYDESEAETVMNHVEAFMRKIAKRLIE